MQISASNVAAVAPSTHIAAVSTIAPFRSPAARISDNAQASTPAPNATQQSAAAAVSTETATLKTPTYSVSVGGKSYSGNVSQSNGRYSIAVSNVPGASVSGSSLSAVERALAIKIDTLV